MPKVTDQSLPEISHHSAGDTKSHATSPLPLFHQQPGSMDEFFLSIKKDAEAATALGERLKTDVVKNFVNIIEKCGGTLITSGIGKQFYMGRNFRRI